MNLVAVPKLEGYYSATRDGRVFSHRSNKFVNPTCTTPKGYYRIRTDSSHGRRGLHVHRIIAAAFLNLDLFDQSIEVHHKDHDKTNNHVDNLEVLSNSIHNTLPRKHFHDSKTHKTCSRCKRLLLRTEFNVSNSRKDGLNTYCKSCQSTYNQNRCSK